MCTNAKIQAWGIHKAWYMVGCQLGIGSGQKSRPGACKQGLCRRIHAQVCAGLRGRLQGLTDGDADLLRHGVGETTRRDGAAGNRVCMYHLIVRGCLRAEFYFHVCEGAGLTQVQHSQL